MIGRAGRPQFDTSATAVILTSNDQKVKYENLVNGRQLVESSLHKNLTEHLNAEIVLGTVTDVGVGIQWLKHTFFYVRALKNPRLAKNSSTMMMMMTSLILYRYYGYSTQNPAALENSLQELCLSTLNALSRVALIKMRDTAEVNSTSLGSLMARFYVAFDTMKGYRQVTGQEDLKEMLSILCKSSEFDEVQLRRSEKATLNGLNKDKKKEVIRYPFKEKVKDRATKVSILIQASLGCLEISDASLTMESVRIMQVRPTFYSGNYVVRSW